MGMTFANEHEWLAAARRVLDRAAELSGAADLNIATAVEFLLSFGDEDAQRLHNFSEELRRWESSMKEAA